MISRMLRSLIAANSTVQNGKVTIDLLGIQALANGTEGGKKIDPQDVAIEGLVYTRRNFSADAGGYNLNLTGALVVNGSGTDGKISISNGKAVVFCYDPAFTQLLSKSNPTCRLKRFFWANF